MRQNQGWSSCLDLALLQKTANTLQISMVLLDFEHLQLNVGESSTLRASELLCDLAVSHAEVHPSPGTWTPMFPFSTKLGIVSELLLIKNI